MRIDIQDLIRSNNLCVLATVSEAGPHCSLMSYAADIDCREIYMITLRESKKFHNLEGNQSVSLLIDTRQADTKNHIKALTVTGTFQSSFDENKLSDIKTILLKINPDLKEFFDNPESAIIIVKIKAVQLLNGITESYSEIVT